MRKPIYYSDITIEAETARTKNVKNAWFISTTPPLELNNLAQGSLKIREELLYIAWKKKSAALLKKKIIKFKVIVRNWKMVGETNE